MLAFFLSPIGRWIGIGVLLLSLLSIGYCGLKKHILKEQQLKEQVKIEQKTDEVNEDVNKAKEDVKKLTDDELADKLRGRVQPKR